MKYSPTIHTSNSGNMITSSPKIMAIIASTGLDIVTPIFSSPFSTASVILLGSKGCFILIQNKLEIVLKLLLASELDLGFFVCSIPGKLSLC